MKTPVQTSLQQRLGERARPTSRIVGYQRWSELLFLHWEVPAEQVQATLPLGLSVDTWEGRAFLGVVPFFMERIRPAMLPPLPWLSWFHELNVRTYVVDSHGRPGVWFFSLDCDQPIAVWLARRWFRLPYQHASFRTSRCAGAVSYEARRKGLAGSDRFEWKRSTEVAPAEPGTLEFFLVERYRLFSMDPEGRLFTGQVHHEPYLLGVPQLRAASAALARASGFDLSDSPQVVHSVAGIDVNIHPLGPVR